MTTTNTIARGMHDVGLAAWFGGSLMGTVGVNGAANDVHEPRERIRVATAGWERWAPVNAMAIGVHLIGAVGVLRANRDRVRSQSGVGAAALAKTILTAAALAATGYAGVLGRQTTSGDGFPADGGVYPSSGTPAAAAAAQKRLRVVQWIVPGLTGALTALASLQGEQQRPGAQVVRVGKQLAESLR